MSKHCPVNPTLTQGCEENYEKIYKNTHDERIKKAYTDGVVFDKAELMAWLEGVTEPSVKISFGVYTEAFVLKYPTANLGRLTTFLCACSTVPSDLPVTMAHPIGDDPDNILNLGTLEP